MLAVVVMSSGGDENDGPSLAACSVEFTPIDTWCEALKRDLPQEVREKLTLQDIIVFERLKSQCTMARYHGSYYDEYASIREGVVWWQTCYSTPMCRSGMCAPCQDNVALLRHHLEDEKTVDLPLLTIDWTAHVVPRIPNRAMFSEAHAGVFDPDDCYEFHDKIFRAFQKYTWHLNLPSKLTDILPEQCAGVEYCRVTGNQSLDCLNAWPNLKGIQVQREFQEPLDNLKRNKLEFIYLHPQYKPAIPEHLRDLVVA